jgi:dTDP-4-amino-4,6-dideoxygalactose transaminase
MARGTFIGGAAVEEFEHAFAALCEAEHCVGVANGTDALEIALRCAGVGLGDRVVLPANTFIATAGAAWRIGAEIVLVDSDHHHLIDVDQLDDAVSKRRAAAVVPVHLYGQLAAVEVVAEIAERRGTVVVEDAAQCHGARRNGRSIAAHSVVASTSFYPGKNLGAYGDGGAVLTNSAEIARRARVLANHGSTEKYLHEEFGMNSRLDTLQAHVLLAKLRRLSDWNKLRQLAAARYDDLLADTDVERPSVLSGNDHVWHLYVVRVPDRDRALERLTAHGVHAGVHYPIPIHLQPAGQVLGYRRGDFPVAEQAAEEILSLPIYPGITAAQQERVIETLLSS